VCDAAIVNAGDGAHEHPTQALLDALTIREHKGRISGLRVAIIGDILHSRVARSNVYLLSKLGASVSVAGPGTLVPAEFAGLIEQGVRVERRIEDAIVDADVIMILRMQRERQTDAFFPSMREYAVHYGLHLSHLSLAAPDAIVMHPGRSIVESRLLPRSLTAVVRLSLIRSPTASRSGWRCSICWLAPGKATERKDKGAVARPLGRACRTLRTA